MINYENSKIYKLRNTTTNKIYIGSTTRDLKTRLREHKSLYTSCKTKKEISYLLFNETDNVIIELLENVNCKNRKELEERELHYIQNLDCINKNCPTRSKSQYYIDNQEKLLKKYHNNKEETNKKRAQKITCECGAIISISVKYKHIKTEKHKAAMKKVGK